MKHTVARTLPGIARALGAVILIAAAPAHADVLTLKNGDRLTGTVVKVIDGNVIIKSVYKVDVTLPWDAVASITADEPVYVGLKNGAVINGALSLKEDKAEILSKESGIIPETRDQIAYIRSKDTYAAEVDRYLNPRLIDLWSASIDFGVAQTRGNAYTSSTTASATATRATPRDKIGVHFTSIKASAKTDGISAATANALRGGIKYDLNLTPRMFTFAASDFEFDEFQQLDLRVAPAWGLGHHAWKADRGFFDWQAGASLNREIFSTGLTRTSGEALLGQELLFRLTQRLSFGEKVVIFPNLTDRGDYRLNADLSINAPLWRWIGWQFTASDRLLSNPVPGAKKNDILFTTGLRLTFAR